MLQNAPMSSCSLEWFPSICNHLRNTLFTWKCLLSLWSVFISYLLQWKLYESRNYLHVAYYYTLEAWKSIKYMYQYVFVVWTNEWRGKSISSGLKVEVCVEYEIIVWRPTWISRGRHTKKSWANFLLTALCSSSQFALVNLCLLKSKSTFKH